MPQSGAHGFDQPKNYYSLWLSRSTKVPSYLERKIFMSDPLNADTIQMEVLELKMFNMLLHGKFKIIGILFSRILLKSYFLNSLIWPTSFRLWMIYGCHFKNKWVNFSDISSLTRIMILSGLFAFGCTPASQNSQNSSTAATVCPVSMIFLMHITNSYEFLWLWACQISAWAPCKNPYCFVPGTIICGFVIHLQELYGPSFA